MKKLEKQETNSRIFWIELLRVVSCYGVILLHTSVIGWKESPLGSMDWRIYNLFHTTTRFAVCCFIMISGSLFLSKKRQISIRRLYQKNIFRCVVALSFWSVFYLGFRIWQGTVEIHGMQEFLSELLYGQYHLWYLYVTIGLYMVVPLLKKITSEKRLCEYFLLLWMISCLLPNMLKVEPDFFSLADQLLSDQIRLSLSVGYVGYFVLGHYLCTYPLSLKKRRLLYILGVCGLIYGVVGGEWYSVKTGEPSQLTCNNLNLNMAVYSAAVFVRFQQLESREGVRKIRAGVCCLSRYTFGIYLIHLLFIQGLSEPFFVHMRMRYALCAVPVAAAVFGLSLAGTAILKKIPVLGRGIC